MKCLKETVPVSAISVINVLPTIFAWISGRKSAERDFREAVELDPTNADAHVGLAGALEDINEPSARAEAQTALRLEPISTDALLVLARLDLKTSQTQSAEQMVDRVLALEPNNSAALALKRSIGEKVQK